MTESTTTSKTFVSKTSNLRLVKKPARRKPIGEHGDFINVPGEDVVFREGRYATSDPGEINFLVDHPNNGRLFHEIGAAPDRPGENTAELHAEIQNAIFDADYDKVADILVRERTTLSRPDVIAACETALLRAGAAVPEKPSAPEHELERVRLSKAVGDQPGAEGLVPAETSTGAPAAAPEA